MKKKQKKHDYAKVLSAIVFMLGGNVAMAEGQKTTAPGKASQLSTMDITARDREITSQIRQHLLNTKSLSTRATNVQIITDQGHVVLKGSVISATEKAEVERIAKSVPGVNAVKNEVQIAN